MATRRRFKLERTERSPNLPLKLAKSAGPQSRPKRLAWRRPKSAALEQVETLSSVFLGYPPEVVEVVLGLMLVRERKPGGYAQLKRQERALFSRLLRRFGRAQGGIGLLNAMCAYVQETPEAQRLLIDLRMHSQELLRTGKDAQKALRAFDAMCGRSAAPKRAPKQSAHRRPLKIPTVFR